MRALQKLLDQLVKASGLQCQVTLVVKPACGLSTVRRQAFLDLLVQNPALLDAMDAQHAFRFFKAFRLGTPDKALNVFGTWAARQADIACALADERFFDADTRQALAGIAILVTQQFPQQSTSLQQQFLQLADGRCSLPVAYALTYWPCVSDWPLRAPVWPLIN